MITDTSPVMLFAFQKGVQWFECCLLSGSDRITMPTAAKLRIQYTHYCSINLILQSIQAQVQLSYMELIRVNSFVKVTSRTCCTLAHLAVTPHRQFFNEFYNRLQQLGVQSQWNGNKVRILKLWAFDRLQIHQLFHDNEGRYKVARNPRISESSRTVSLS